MLPLLLTLTALGQAHPAPASPIKLASPGFQGVGIAADAVALYSDHFANALALEGVRVVTQREIASLLGLERQKQLLGCSEGSCMTELANALGVDGVIVGSLGKLDQTYQLELKIVSAVDGSGLSAYSGKAKSSDALLAALDDAAASIAADLAAKLHRPLIPLHAGGEVRAHAWIPAVAGGALLVGGAVCYALAKGVEGQLSSGIPNPNPLIQTGETEQTLAFALGGAGVAALAAAGLMAWLGGPLEPRPAAVAIEAVSGGVGLTVGGRF